MTDAYNRIYRTNKDFTFFKRGMTVNVCKVTHIFRINIFAKQKFPSFPSIPSARMKHTGRHILTLSPISGSRVFSVTRCAPNMKFLTYPQFSFYAPTK